MGLIKGALRRCNGREKDAIPPGGLGLHLQPVEYARRARSWWYFLAAPMALAFLGLSVWLLFVTGKPAQKLASNRDRLQANARKPVLSPTMASSQPIIKLASASPVANSKPTEAIQFNTNLVARTDLIVRAPPPAPAITEASHSIAVLKTNLPAFAAAVAKLDAPVPKLKLQGIYFRRTNPSVLINGRTLFVGDRVEGARVVTIDRQSVTVEFGGQTSLLTL